MSMPSFYNTEECGELFAEKIPTKLLQKKEIVTQLLAF